jgi:small membrane protein
MIAQLILSALLVGILFYAWIEYPRAPAIGLLAVAAGWAGLFFVWLPEHATNLAAFVGVGRGVDLIIYVWIGISLIVLLNLHLKIRVQMELITALARALALANARATVSRPPEAGEQRVGS